MMKKWQNVLIIIILMLIPVFFSAYYRYQPTNLPAFDTYARDRVVSYYRDQVKAYVDKTAGYLPEEEKNKIVDDRMADIISQKKEDIERDIRTLSTMMRQAYQDENNDTYLLAIDPYMQYYYTQNYVKTGTYGDVIKDGKPYVSLRGGRFLIKNNFRFHPWLMSMWYKLFPGDVSIMHAVFLFPILISSLGIMFAFLIGRRISGNFAGFVGAMVAATHASLISRTAAGFSDTDIYNILMPMLTLWLVLEAWNTKNKVWKWASAILAGFSIAIYSMAWSGFWFTHDFVLGILGISIVYFIIKKRLRSFKDMIKDKDVANALFTILVYFVSSIVFFVLFKMTLFENTLSNALDAYFIMMREPIRFISFKAVAVYSIWPNVFTTVAELNPASVSKVVGTLAPTYNFWKITLSRYGQVLFFFALAGIGYLFSGKKRIAHMDVKLFVSWLGFSIFIALFGRSVDAFLGASMVGAFAIMAYYVYNYYKRYVDNKRDHVDMQKAFMWFAIGWGALSSFISTYFTISTITMLVYIWVPLVVAFVLTLVLRDFSVNIRYPALLTVFISGTFYAATRGIRFSALNILFVSLGIGVFAQFIYEYGREIHSLLKVPRWAMSIIVILIVLPFTIAIPMNQGWKQASLGEVPSFNDAWYDTLMKIKQDPDNAIITSWWDFGHWFYSISRKMVTFDGGDQGNRIHWVGKTLLTSDEKEAVNILRMLNCGQNKVYETLMNATNDSYDAIKTTYELLPMKKDDARSYLEDKGLDKGTIDNVMRYGFCDDLYDQYFIASQDMIGKSGVWAHFGIWDFDRAHMFNEVATKNKFDGVKILVDEYNMSQDDAEKEYDSMKKLGGDQWISPWPSYAMGGWSGCNKLDNKTLMISCPLGVKVGSQNGRDVVIAQADINVTNLSNSRMLIGIVDKGSITGITPLLPKELVIVDENLTRYKISGLERDLVLEYDPSNNRALVVPNDLAESLFTKMFFFEGKSLKYFDLVSSTIGPDGQRIYLYKLDWNRTKWWE